MKQLRFWTLHSQEVNGLTLLCEGRHHLKIMVLEDHLWRVWLTKDGVSALDRTWLISPEGAPVAKQGRPRILQDGFSCPHVHIEQKEEMIILTGKTLRLTITQPLALIWEEKATDGNWQLLAQDSQTHSYMLGHSRGDVKHHMRLQAGDRYFGLGEKAGRVDHMGKRYQMRSLDAMGYNAETTDPLYKHWPFYQVRTQSGQHYGLFYDNLNTTWFDMGNELDNYHLRYRTYHAEAGDLDYYFIHGGSITEITQRFLAITGKTFFPPKWSLGYSGSTMHYTDAPDAQVQLQHFIRLCQEHAIPCDSFQLSSGYTSINDKRYVFNWNHDKIPDPKGLAQTFRNAGIRLAANIKPCLLHDHPRYEEVKNKGLFIQDSENPQPERSMFWDDHGSHLDFTNPDTQEWWKENVKKQLLEYGICSTWNDNNEYEVWDDNARCNGFGNSIAIHHIRPLMPLLMMQSSYEAQSEYSNERPYLISRSGCPGMQRYVQTWSGDNRTSWHTIKWNIRMAIGMSLSGMYHIGHDIGGFAGAKPDPEMFLRWIQSALFLPRFTIHSWNDDGSVNEPWMYPSITPAVRSAIALRYRLIPYLYTQLYLAHAQELPFVRPLFLDHEHDEPCFEDSDGYLIGADLLTYPVTEANVRKRDCYLPDNQLGWYDYYSEVYYLGGQSIHIDVPLEKVPLFVRAGSILPEGRLNHADSPDKDTVRILRIFPSMDARSTQGMIFDDDGLTRDGTCFKLHWQMHTTSDTITVSFKQSGDFCPAYLNNIVLQLPHNESRELIIHGDIDFNLGECSC